MAGFPSPPPLPAVNEVPGKNHRMNPQGRPAPISHTFPLNPQERFGLMLDRETKKYVPILSF